MSSLHWEARRRQNVADKMKLFAETNVKLNSYDEENIEMIADKFCTDPAIPTQFLLNKSKAALQKTEDQQKLEKENLNGKKSVSFDNVCEKIEISQCQEQEPEKRYTARIPDRYTSTNYIQQY